MVGHNAFSQSGRPHPETTPLPYAIYIAKWISHHEIVGRTVLLA